MKIALPFLLILCFAVSSSEAAGTPGFYVWPSDWACINNKSLPSETDGFTSTDGPLRLLVASSGESILSGDDQSSFGLGFVDLNSTGRFVLSIVFRVGYRTPPSAIVWTANRGRPVGENASLRIGSSGNMVLHDWDGSEVWNSGTGKVSALSMQSYGQLELYNSTNSSLQASTLVWRSWTAISPTQQALVQGQALPTGSQLVSNASAFSTDEGLYRLVMEPGGVVLYTGTNKSGLQPYWIWGLAGAQTYQSILSPCLLSNTRDEPSSRLVFSGQALDLTFSGCPSSNGSSTSISGGITFGSNGELQFRFVRLEDDGNLRSFIASTVAGQGSTTAWALDYELFATGSAEECQLPNVCGPYGICLNGQCSCPGSGTDDAFVQVDSVNPKKGCMPPRALICNNQTHDADHHFLELPGVDYFLNSFSNPDSHASTLEECRNLCSSNCSCTAFFFHNSSRSCFQALEQLQSLKTAASNVTVKAYLKVQNAPTPIAVASSKGLSKGSIAGITIGAAAAVLLLLMLVLVRVRANEPDFNDPDEEQEAEFLHTLPGLPPRFTLKELRKATNEFKKRLGAGGFGTVYEGFLKDGSKVAVKRLNAARQGHKEFRAEVATIGSINHVNLVRLRGFCAEKGERLLIYELVENGSLDRWIFKDKSLAEERALDWETRVSIAIGTAKALEYLHEHCREVILHLDIKPQNILVNHKFIPKVSDFGMARLMEGDMTEVVTALRGTPGYIAPEWLRASIATTKCDVYSFGMLLLELIGGRRNFDQTLVEEPSKCYFPSWAKLKALEGKYMDLVDERIMDTLHKNQEEEVVKVTKIAFCCIHEDPRMRPTMGQVVKMLEGHDTNIPTLAALGLTIAKDGELRSDSAWDSMFSGPSSFISNEQLSGPR